MMLTLLYLTPPEDEFFLINRESANKVSILFQELPPRSWSSARNRIHPSFLFNGVK